MNGPMYIPISANALSTAAELARQCSATTVRERVLVSQVVALAVREYLHRTAGLQTAAGRSASLKYVELLDICDFNASDWRVEMRVVTHVERWHSMCRPCHSWSVCFLIITSAHGWKRISQARRC